MKITALISNRQSGKTCKANYEFIKDPENSLFVGLSHGNIIQQPYYNIYKNNHISVEKIDYVKGRRLNNIILDEYLFYGQNSLIRIYDLLKYITKMDSNIYIFSSPYVNFNINKFEYVSQMKEDGIYSSAGMCENFIKRFGIDTEDNFNKYYYNLLTEPNCKIINDDYFNNKNIESNPLIVNEIEKYGKLF